MNTRAELKAAGSGGTEGEWTAEELEALRAAYAAGAVGAVLMGLRRRKRLLTLLLPVKRSEEAAAQQMREATVRLRRLRCDGYAFARLARLRRSGTAAGVGSTLWVEEQVCGRFRLRAVPLEGGEPRVLSSDLHRDRVSLALTDAFEEL